MRDVCVPAPSWNGRCEVSGVVERNSQEGRFASLGLVVFVSLIFDMQGQRRGERGLRTPLIFHSLPVPRRKRQPERPGERPHRHDNSTRLLCLVSAQINSCSGVFIQDHTATVLPKVLYLTRRISLQEYILYILSRKEF